MNEDSAPQEIIPLPAPQAPKFRISGNRAELFGALAAARGAFSELETSRRVTVQGKDGKSGYTFDYADLASLQEATVPALAAQGLTICQVYWDEGNGHVLLTMLVHKSGAALESEVYVSQQENIQKLGSALTYHKRYQWGGICGIAAKRDDDDGNAAVGARAQFTDKPQVPQGRPKPAPAARPAASPENRPKAKPSTSNGQAQPEQPKAATEPAQSSGNEAPAPASDTERPAPEPEHNPETGEVPATGPITPATAKLVRETLIGAGVKLRQAAVSLLVEFCGKGIIDDLTEAQGLKLLEPGRIPELMAKLGIEARS